MTSPATPETHLKFDRSRFITYQDCPRARYFEYEWEGVGLRRVRQSIHLAAGRDVHAGYACLLRGEGIEQAVKEAVGAYDKELVKRGLDLEPNEDASYVADEQRALIEGLLRTYDIVGLPGLLQKYDVLEVEREDLWERFAVLPQAPLGGPLPPVDFMARADALLREKETGDLYVDSLKTAGVFDRRTDEQNQHDVQGLSEAAAIEHRLRHWYTTETTSDAIPRERRPAWFLNLVEQKTPPRIMGVHMTYLLKGVRRQYPEDSGLYRTFSHLLRGWWRPGVTGRELAWRYQWYGPEVNESTGKLVQHRLGRDWKPFETFGVNGIMTVSEWVEMLASGEIQTDAGDPLRQLVIEPIPYFRQDEDMANWIEQAQYQELEVALRARQAEWIRQKDPEMLKGALNQLFPQHKRKCDWPSRCQFQAICYGDKTAFFNPVGTGLYMKRVPHHAPEKAGGEEEG